MYGANACNGRGKPPPYMVGIFRPIWWFLVHTGGRIWNPPLQCAYHSTTPYRRQDTQVPPYEIIRNPVPAGLRGPPQQCEAWIENLTAPIQSHRTKPLKKLKIPNFKSFTRFFSCEGCPPPVCLRCSPGLFRHGGGAASCHTSSMAANPHLALTQNSSPTTLANGRRTAQIAGVQGAAPPVAPRKARNARWPQPAKSPYRIRSPAPSSPRNP